MGTDTITTNITSAYKCKGCGAGMIYHTASGNLQCQYCNEQEVIDSGVCLGTAVDYERYIIGENTQPNSLLTTVKCQGCGSTTVLDPNMLAEECPFCAAPLVVIHTDAQNVVRPHYILPFLVDQQTAAQYFKKWIKSRWFTPFDLNKQLSNNVNPPMKGVYMPHWSYDANTVTHYTGRRGEYYYVTETYTVTVEGKTETRTRQVRHTRWYDVRGRVDVDFRDIMVSATHSIHKVRMAELEPWDLPKLKNFDERYLCGFRSENFQVTPQSGLEYAKTEMEPRIREDVKRDIGGDEQEIDTTDTEYDDIGIKYLMLPVWISAFKYKDKVYQFMVNARTGEVIGERPYSAIKITLFVLFILAIIAAVVLYFNHQ